MSNDSSVVDKKETHYMEDSNTGDNNRMDTDIIVIERLPVYDNEWDVYKSISMWYT